MTAITLSEIAAQMAALDEMLEASGGEVTPDVEALLTTYSLAEAEKVDGYILFLKDLELRAQATKSAEDELAMKRRALENRARWLKERIAGYMAERGVRELRGLVWRFAFQRNGGKAPVEVLTDPRNLPHEFQKVTVEADKERLREALAGEHPGKLAGLARIGPVGESLRIR
jgi:hypothetical protein